MEDNCVLARGGGEQSDTNVWSVGNELDSAGRRGHPASEGEAQVTPWVARAMETCKPFSAVSLEAENRHWPQGDDRWLETERTEGSTTLSREIHPAQDGVHVP